MHFSAVIVAALGFMGTALAVPSLVAREEPSAVVDGAALPPVPTILLSSLMSETARLPSGAPTVSNSTELVSRANSWNMQTFFATSCQGSSLVWTTGAGNWCILNDGTDWHSLRVNNFGGCRTLYFSGRGCSGGVEVTNSGCWGFSQAEPIRAYQVICPT